MSFIRKTWADFVTGNTPITAVELNRIEQGVTDGDVTNPASAAAAALLTNDANAASPLRVQQDARLSATFVMLGPAPSGGDDTAALQAAINSAISTGKRHLILSGVYSCAGKLNFNDALGLSIEGSSTATDHRLVQPTEINYTGTAAPFISARQSSGVQFRKVSITYSGALTGYLIDVSGTLAMPTTRFVMEDCTLGGKGGVNGAWLVCARGAVGFQFIRTVFRDATRAIVGQDTTDVSTNFSNEVLISSCNFHNFVAAPILNPHTGWTINGRTYFEYLVGGAAGAIEVDPTHAATNLTIRDTGFWDISTGGGNWIIWRGGSGLVVDGCRADLGNSATFLRLEIGSVAMIQGNVMSGSAGAKFINAVSAIPDLLEQANYLPDGIIRQTGAFTRTAVATGVRGALDLDNLLKWDTFNRTDNGVDLGMSDDGSAWTLQSQRCRIENTLKAAYFPGLSGYGAAYKNTNGANGDGKIVAHVRTGDTTFPDLFFRSGSGGSSYLRLRFDGTNAKIQSYVTGTVTDLATAAFPTYALTGYWVEIFMTRNRIVCRVNGETAVAYTLSAGEMTTYGSLTYFGWGVDLTTPGSTAALLYNLAYYGGSNASK
jgi:hypothetical protein